VGIVGNGTLHVKGAGRTHHGTAYPIVLVSDVLFADGAAVGSGLAHVLGFVELRHGWRGEIGHVAENNIMAGGWGGTFGDVGGLPYGNS